MKFRLRVKASVAAAFYGLFLGILYMQGVLTFWQGVVACIPVGVLLAVIVVMKERKS